MCVCACLCMCVCNHVAKEEKAEQAWRGMPVECRCWRIRSSKSPFATQPKMQETLSQQHKNLLGLNAGLVFPEKCRCSGVRLSSRKPLSSHSLLETDAVQPPFLRSPRCCAFFRFHNGTLLDRRQQGSGPHLELQGLLMEQAGEYHCKAWNDAGTVRSRAAHLTILGECGPVPPHPSPAQAPSPSASLP